MTVTVITVQTITVIINHPPRKNYPKKRRGIPWDSESLSEDYDSEYSTDSLYSSDNDSIYSHGVKSKTTRVRKREQKAKRYEMDKLENFACRRWVKRIHHKYHVQIREQIGAIIPNIDGLKSIKVLEPEHYAEDPDVEKFEGFLMAILRWMVVNKVSGPDADHIRVQCLGMLLSGNALQYYNDEIGGPHREREEWTFEDAIIALFDHCVQTSTIHEAADKFDNVRYDPRKGVKRYYNTLGCWAYRMISRPDKFTFKRRFVDGLPKEMIPEMIKRGAVPDYSTVKQMVKAVQQYEDDNAIEKYYFKRKSSSEAKQASNNSNQRDSGGNQPRHHTLQLSEQARKVGGRRYQGACHSRSPPRYRQGGQKPNIDPRKFGSAKPNTQSKNNFDKSKPKPTGSGALLCYGCGKVGHYASDPTCERYGQPKLFAIGDDLNESSEPVNDEDQAQESPENSETEVLSSEGESIAEQSEDYGAYMANDADFGDWMGRISENDALHINLDDIYNPLADLGPAVVIEDDVEESQFPSIDLNTNPYTIGDQLFAVNQNKEPDVLTVDV
ncbi:hypothetical protein PM082_019753 [Marasmius tenuissimus]|nr:hypothetical protein PM082_019753 [Marasmius tenuissimus]